jgi:rhodanese-related sulfurtransferase
MTELIDFATRHPFLVLAAGLLLVMIVTHEWKLLTRRYREIEAGELVRLVNGGALLLDLRDSNHFKSGHIAGARNVAFGDLDAQLAKLAGGDKAKPVITYCDNGLAGGKAAAWLAANGYPAASTLRGGLASWRADNLPLARG